MNLPKSFNLDLSDENLLDKLKEECGFNNDELDGFRISASLYSSEEKIKELLIENLQLKENLFDVVYAYDFRKDANKKDLILSYLVGLIYSLNKSKF